MMTTMETHIMVENGISYVLGGGSVLPRPVPTRRGRVSD